jgi:methionyl-tRNA formyltransferase
MSNHAQSSRVRCLFFGTPCAFASPILAALARPDVEIAGIVSPHPGAGPEPFVALPAGKRRPHLPMHQPRAHFGAPRVLVRNIADPDLAEALAALQPDLIVVACYPRLIPASVSDTARVAAVNVHPSLLPRHRGPDPLFWTFHGGDDQSGVTVHLLSPEFDAGAVLFQRETAILPGESLADLEKRLATIGASLIGDLIDSLPCCPAARPQPRGTLERLPYAEDLVVEPNWTVDRAARFIAGVGRSHGPLAYVGRDGNRLTFTALARDGEGQDIHLADGSLSVV